MPVTADTLGDTYGGGPGRFYPAGAGAPRGSATPWKMGGGTEGTGTRRQRSQDFLQRVTRTKNRKPSGFSPLFS